MPLCTIEQIYNSAWGIVEHRRTEIEQGEYGIFERILREEVHRQFLSTDGVAALMDVHASTAHKWLRAENARYIIFEGGGALLPARRSSGGRAAQASKGAYRRAQEGPRGTGRAPQAAN